MKSYVVLDANCYFSFEDIKKEDIGRKATSKNDELKMKLLQLLTVFVIMYGKQNCQLNFLKRFKNKMNAIIFLREIFVNFKFNAFS